MQKFTPFLWFDDQAEEAANFYTSIFKNSKIGRISRYGEGGPGAKGTVMSVTFQLEGQEFMALYAPTPRLFLLTRHKNFVGLISMECGYNTWHQQQKKEERRMGRPVGVTILAILCFLAALFCILGGIGMLAGGGFMASMISQQGGQGAGLLAGLGAALGVVYLVFAVIDILLGWGLWTLKNWARIISLVLLVIGAIFGVIGLVGTLAHFNVISFLITIIVLAIYGLVIWYLLRPDVKAAFQGGGARAAGA